MRIDGITTCCGELYAGYLAKALPVWLDTLDSLTVIIGTDQLPFSLPKRGDLTQVPSNVFTADGAQFNKGRALNRAIEIARSTDWLLAFDCDIIPPANWRELAEPQLQPGNLYGARRYSPEGGRVDRRWYPRGFFQLWHTSDEHYNQQRPFSEAYPDAGGYDTEFANQWPLGHWVDLGIPLVHQGEKCTHWCGPGTTKDDMKAALARSAERQKARR